MRGKPLPRPGKPYVPGNIPAYAGKTVSQQLRQR